MVSLSHFRWNKAFSSNLPCHSGGMRLKRRVQRQQRLVVSTGISCVFTLCLAAIPNTLMLFATGLEKGSYEGLANLAYLSTLTNSFPNVLIYSLRHRELRDTMKDTVLPSFCCSGDRESRRNQLFREELTRDFSPANTILLSSNGNVVFRSMV